jgi:hypothetical protein
LDRLIGASWGAEVNLPIAGERSALMFIPCCV